MIEDFEHCSCRKGTSKDGDCTNMYQPKSGHGHGGSFFTRLTWPDDLFHVYMLEPVFFDYVPICSIKM